MQTLAQTVLGNNSLTHTCQILLLGLHYHEEKWALEFTQNIDLSFETRLKVSIYSREQFDQNWTIDTKMSKKDKIFGQILILVYDQYWSILQKYDKIYYNK